MVAIDGKTVRGAKSGGKKSPVHLVSAWANHNNLVLGQVRVNEESNEITAIPQLLEVLEIESCIVTIDAMRCQNGIAKKITDKKADYILAVKNNQKQLYQDIKEEFRFAEKTVEHQIQEIDHGRIETRKCSLVRDFQFIENNDKWKNLKTIMKIESEREFKNSDSQTEKADRYYIFSLVARQSISRLPSTATGHRKQTSLNLAFGEDVSQKRTGNSSQNFAYLNKIALNLLKNKKSSKIGGKSRRLRPGRAMNI